MLKMFETNSKFKRLFVVLIIFILTFANVAILGSKMVSYAASEQSGNIELGLVVNAKAGDASISSGSSVKQGQYITYTIDVNNTGNVAAKNVLVKATLENATLIRDNSGVGSISGNTIEWIFPELPANSKGQIVCTVQIDSEAVASEVKNTVVVTADNLATQVIKEFKNTITDAKMNVMMYKKVSGDNFNNNVKITYTIRIENITSETLSNIKIVNKLPEGLKYADYSYMFIDNLFEGTIRQISYDANYDSSKNELSWELESLGRAETLYITYDLRINIPEGKSEVLTNNSAKVTVGEETYYTNTEAANATGAALTIEQIANLADNSNIKEGDQIEFTVTVKNVGKNTANYVKIEDGLPKEFEVVSATYTQKNQTKELMRQSNNQYVAFINVEPQETVVAKIIVRAKIVNGEDSKTVSNIVKVKSASLGELTANILSYTIQKNANNNNNNNNSNNNNDNNPIPDSKLHSISGLAWIDSNSNGAKDLGEKGLKGLKVLLIDAETGMIVKDATSGIKKEMNTGEDGSYTFSNIPKGKYIAIVEYDTNSYKLTEYKKAGVQSGENSKVNQTTISQDNVKRVVGITDILTISDLDIVDVNAGLIELTKFDLSLGLKVANIVVKTGDETKTYELNASDLSKVEIPAKDIVNSTIFIEYIFIVKNEGTAAGYAKELVTYFPKDLTFDAQDGSGWYYGNDGNLYTDLLKEKILNPGDTAEVKLVLAKKMTEDNPGLITTKGEITNSSSSVYGLKDIDSSPNNKVEDEDDFARIDVIVAVKTGKAAMYITLSLGIIGLLACGAYGIRKYVIR